MSARRVDRYEILETTYSRASIEVHLAQDTATGRLVTLETLASDVFPSRRRSEHWLDQVRSLRTLRHPNLLAVLDADRNGCFYVTREWVAGQTLASLLDADWKFDALQTAQIGAALAEGLAYLHRNGRLHGAVCPQNVILGTEGEIRLAGLGAMIQPGGIQAEFLAPELLAGHNPGRATDLFGLGAILRRLYANCEPWPYTRSAGSFTAVKDPLAALIHTLTAEEPSLRPASTSMVAETLQALIRRACPGAQPEEDEAELIDLSPEVLLAIPHYIAAPRSKAEALVEDAEPLPDAVSAPAPRRRRRRARRLTRFARMASAAVVGVLALLGIGWRLNNVSAKPHGGSREQSTKKTPTVTPPTPVSGTPAKPEEAPAGLKQVLQGWAKSWETHGWEMHVAHYANPVEKFRDAQKRTREEIAKYRQTEATRLGVVRVRTLNTKVDADGVARAEVQTEWGQNKPGDKLMLRLKRVHGNWRIFSETDVDPSQPSSITAQNRSLAYAGLSGGAVAPAAR